MASPNKVTSPFPDAANCFINIRLKENMLNLVIWPLATEWGENINQQTVSCCAYRNRGSPPEYNIQVKVKTIKQQLGQLEVLVPQVRFGV